MLGDMLEAVRWPQDPSPAPSGAFNRDGGAKGGKPESPSATRIRVPVGQIGTSTLAAHPTRQLFLAGTSPPPPGPLPPPSSCAPGYLVVSAKGVQVLEAMLQLKTTMLL